MVAIFNRRKNQTNVPAEIQEYYQSERRERAGIAWLLAFGTLLVTIVIAAGLFYGGRWTYRQIAGNDEPEVAQNENPQDSEQQANPNNNSSGENPNNTNSNQQTEEEKKAAEEEKKKQEEEAAKKAEEEKKAAEAEAQKKAEEEKQAQHNASTNGSSSSSSSSNHQPTTGDSGQVAGTSTGTIPNTGPEDVFAIAAVIAVAAYAIHRILINAIAAIRRG